MILCGKCEFSFEPAGVPGGLCPRCLLLGVHNSRATGLATEPVAELAEDELAEDELAEELPGFELVESLGRGGMGAVWKATERVLNRHVAIKLLHNVRKDMDFVERFAREARVMAQLSHPNIVTLFSFGRTRSNHCYLVMEMVEGADLGSLLARGPLEVHDALKITQEVCGALRYAHDAGFMHRDIKPGNVLIDRRGRIKIADFGLARLTDDIETASITRHGTAVGTPHYIAPEQARGDGAEDHRADIYSVGVMLYQMLTGELPRGVFRPPSEKRKVDKRLDKVVFRALQESPEERYQCLDELVADLQKVRENVDPGMQAEQKVTRRRQRFEMALAIAVSLVLGIVIADYVRGWLQSPPKASAAKERPLPDGGVVASEPVRLPPAAGLSIAREIRLQPPGLTTGSLFGRSLAANGSWIAVGAPDDASQNPSDVGCVYLYYRRDSASGWALHQVLSNPHPGTGSRFGYDVALDGTRLVVGSPRRSASPKGVGSVDLFELPAPGGRWRPVSPPLPAWPTAALGLEVMVSGRRVLAFEPQGKGPGKERAPSVLFTLPAGANAWVQDPIPFGLACCAFTGAGEMIGSMTGPPETLPPSLRGAPLFAGSPGGMDLPASARSVRPPDSASELPADFRAIAATGDAVLAGNANWQHATGVAWMLRRDAGGGFVQDAVLRPPADAGPGEFAGSVALLSDWAVIGAGSFAADGPRRGAVFIYERRRSGSWEPVLTIPADPAGGAMDFGRSIGLTPEFVAAGAPGSGGPGSTGEEAGTGAVFVFEFATPLRGPATAVSRHR